MKTPITDPDVALLAALGDPVRFALVRQIAAVETCACDLTACVDVSQPTISHHLRVLREAGVVTSERRGTWIYYSIAPGVAERLSRIAATLVPAGEQVPAGALGRPTGRQLPVLTTG